MTHHRVKDSKQRMILCRLNFLKLLLFCHVVSSAADMTIHMHQIQIQDVARTWFSTLDPIDTGCVTKFHGRKLFSFQ